MNGAYSLRAFSRDLGLSPATLSEALNGRHKISKVTAQKIATKMMFSPAEADYFIDLVEQEGVRSQTQRRRMQEEFRKNYIEKKYFPLSRTEFSHISEWFYVAILELAHITSVKLEPHFVARALGITKTTAKLALVRLKDLKLLAEDEFGVLKPTHVKTATSSRVPSRDIQDFHCQILDKAKTALVTQSLETREFSCSFLAIDGDKIAEAKTALKAFRRKFCTKVQDSKEKHQLYCLSMQFFRAADLNFVEETNS